MRKRLADVIGVAAAGAIVLGAQMASATFPGTEGRIAFQAFVEKTESVEIFTAKPNGSDVQKLTSNRNAMSALPDWSQDGQRIAFDSDRVDVDGRKNVVQVHVMNADGSGVTQLTKGPGFHSAPSWSPDAASLAIEADWGDERGLQGIWIIPASDPDGVARQEARRLTTPSNALDTEPQFSPDGGSIVFTRFKDFHKSAIHRVNVDGTGLERLTDWKLNASDPDWSPDGQMITFDSGDAGRQGSKGNIYLMRADGGDRTKLTDFPPLPSQCCPPRRGPGTAQNPVWSPSGDEIMFTHFLPKGNKLVAMKPNGSDKHTVVGGDFTSKFANKVDWGTHP